jgi:hypothetical protein
MERICVVFNIALRGNAFALQHAEFDLKSENESDRGE